MRPRHPRPRHDPAPRLAGREVERIARQWKSAKRGIVLVRGTPRSRVGVAERLAAALQLGLHRVDLSRTVSRYIGETEKNLSRVLGAPEEADVLLFFDEADALFGRRTDVSDSHDRYANVATSLLDEVQRRGTVLLAAPSGAAVPPELRALLVAVVDADREDAPD